MSAEVDRSRLTMPLETAGRLNQPDICGGFKNDRQQTSSRHYSFSCEEKAIVQKRRYSERVASSAAHNFRKKFARFANRGNLGKIVLPTKFLLGGNIRDPLNLNSLCDEEINRSLNEVTPVSSPLPIPSHRLENKVPIIHPANIHDPLNLEDSNIDAGILTVPLQKKRKRRHSHRKTSKAPEKTENGADAGEIGRLMKPLTVKIDSMEGDVLGQKRKAVGEFKKIVNKIVSPVIPQVSPKRKQRRTLSESRNETRETGHKTSQAGDAERLFKSERITTPRSKGKRNSMTQSSFKGKNARFVHGNYSTYLGYRTPAVEDPRLKMFSREMFEGKDVLDIGCNAGHFTLGVAQKFSPKKIVGIDVDGKLVEAAKKNVRHYMGEEAETRFPVSLKIMRGPLAAHPLLRSGDGLEDGKFPHNVVFQKANYHLESNKEVQSQQPEYDVILALGITKWIHLNYGDAGLKRCFLRMFRQLRPGGTLILEAQKWGSYRKKKKQTEHTFQIYKSIQFRPDHFREFLTSREVGFSSCRFLGLSSSKSKGSSATVHIFTKDVDRELDKACARAVVEPEAKVFGFCEVKEPTLGWADGTENRSSLARFEAGSSYFTPCSTCENSPSYSHTTHSSTPWTERTCSSVEGIASSKDVPSLFNHLTDQIGNSPVGIEESEGAIAKSWLVAGEDMHDLNGH